MQHGYHENYQDLQEVSHKRTLQSRVTAALQLLFGSKMAVLQGSFGSKAYIEFTCCFLSGDCRCQEVIKKGLLLYTCVITREIQTTLQCVLSVLLG